MSLFSSEDYKRENLKNNKTKNPRRSKYHGGIRTAPKVRLGTQYKSKVKYCRNCNCKNKDNAITCTQCEVTFRGKPVRSPMK